MRDPIADNPRDQGELLVVDDEPFLRDAVAASLRFLGFGVSAAETGTQALRLARDHAFDLMVLDVMLPDTDGFEVVRRLRGEGNKVPVIFLTAREHSGRQGHWAHARRRRLHDQAVRARRAGGPGALGAAADSADGRLGAGAHLPRPDPGAAAGTAEAMLNRPHGLSVTLTLPVAQPAAQGRLVRNAG